MASYPVDLDVEHPEKLSRGLAMLKLFFGWIYVGIPHGICLWVFGIAVGIVTFIAAWIILFTGKYPKGMYDVVVRYMRWTVRVNVYISLLRDEYPPFHGRES
jgi:hypothetical protein